MTRRLRVEWTSVAAGDLRAIVEFIADEDPAAAARVLYRLERAAASLETMASRGRLVPELLRIQVREHRELVVRPWRILYRMGASGAVVLGVFDGRRDLEDVVLDRLIRQG